MFRIQKFETEQSKDALDRKRTSIDEISIEKLWKMKEKFKNLDPVKRKNEISMLVIVLTYGFSVEGGPFSLKIFMRS